MGTAPPRHLQECGQCGTAMGTARHPGASRAPWAGLEVGAGLAHPSEVPEPEGPQVSGPAHCLPAFLLMLKKQFNSNGWLPCL